MMKFTVLVLTALSAALFAPSFVHGADSVGAPKRAKSAKSVKPSIVAPVPTVGLTLSESFDESMSTLPSRFLGHNIEGLFNYLYARRNEYKKDTFETKQMYLERMDKVASTTGPRQIAIGGKMNARYDAEKQQFSVSNVLLSQILSESLVRTYAFQIQEKEGLPART